MATLQREKNCSQSSIRFIPCMFLIVPYKGNCDVNIGLTFFGLVQLRVLGLVTNSVTSTTSSSHTFLYDLFCSYILEYERCLVLLDLALQVPSAYRHVIVNCCAGEGGDRINTKFLLKLVFVTLIIDGFCKWQETNEISKQKNLNDEFLVEKMEAIDFIHQEYQFYSQVINSKSNL